MSGNTFFYPPKSGSGSGSGTVTSVGLSAPVEFGISGSPVTSSGTLSFSWLSENQNLVLASPDGVSGIPSFRALVANDIPPLPYAPLSGSVSGSGAVTEVAFWTSPTTLSSNPALIYDAPNNLFRAGDFSGATIYSTFLEIDNSAFGGWAKVYGQYAGVFSGLGLEIDFNNQLFGIGDINSAVTGGYFQINTSIKLAKTVVNNVQFGIGDTSSLGGSSNSIIALLSDGTNNSNMFMNPTDWEVTLPNGTTGETAYFQSNSSTGSSFASMSHFDSAILRRFTLSAAGIRFGNAAGTMFTLPSIDGSANYAMVTDGSANLSFAQVALPSDLANYLPLAGGTMSGVLTLNPAVQLNPNDAATIGQLSSFVSGLVWKTPSADLATTGNITLSGEQTIDGTLTNLSTILVWQQSTASDNGVYITDAGAWTRRTDLDSGAELNAATISVTGGLTYAGQAFTQITPTPNVGVDPIIFTRIGISYSAGAGLALSGNAFSIAAPVSISLGGTNNTAAYTAGSVIFSDGTKLTEDNDGLFWDNTNNNFGINTFASPTLSLTVGGVANPAQYPSLAFDGFGISSASTNQITAIVENTAALSTTGGASMALCARPGTAMTANMRLGSIQFLGDPGGFSAQRLGAMIVGRAVNTWSNTNANSQLEFYTTPNASTTPVLRVKINSSGLSLVDAGTGFSANFLTSSLTNNRFYQFQDATMLIANVPGSGICTSTGTTLQSTAFPAAGGVITSTGSGLSSYARQTLKVTATQSLTSVTPTNITQLTSSSLQPATYRAQGLVIYQSASAAVGIGLRLNQGSGSISQVYGKYLISQAADGTAKNFQYDQVSLATNITSTATLAANTDTVAQVDLTFKVGTAGTVALQFRGETAGAAVSIRSGSYLIIEEI